MQRTNIKESSTKITEDITEACTLLLKGLLLLFKSGNRPPQNDQVKNNITFKLYKVQLKSSVYLVILI